MPGSFILPLILGLPLLGAILVMCTPKTESTLHRGVGLGVTTITLATFVVKPMWSVAIVSVGR